MTSHPSALSPFGLKSVLTDVLAGLLVFIPGTMCLASEPRAVRELPPLVMGQGEQRLLHIEGLEKYSLGSPVVKVIPAPLAHSIGKDSLLMKALTPGSGDLWIWTRATQKNEGEALHRSIRVEKTISDDLKPLLARALSGLEEAEVQLSGSGVVLHGEVQSLAEVKRIGALTLGFPQEVHDESELSDPLLQKGRDLLSAKLRGSGYLGRLQLDQFGRTLWIRGNLEKKSEQDKITAQLRAVFPKVEFDLQSLPDGAPTVHFKVYLLELKKSHFRSLGLSWPGSTGSAFRVTTSGVQDLLQLDLALQALEGDGSAKILSNPELVVRAPGEAELFSGGELPIHQASHFYSNITWKPYGLTLKLSVTHTTQERVRLDIFTEVSHLDSSQQTDDKVPGIRANRMKTQVDARYGKPLLLSGLLQDEMRKEAKGLPLLRQIPVLGALFGSEDYLNERSELVAILLPSLTPPEPPMERVAHLFPRGPVPLPRNYLSPEAERTATKDADYPWNTLQ